MTPGNLPMVLRRNAPDPLVLHLEGPDGPLDLTGYSLRLEVRLYPGQPGAPYLSATTANGVIVITDAAAGSVKIDWPQIADEIEALPVGSEAGNAGEPRVDTFSYDLLLFDPDGRPQAILEGPAPVPFGVTIP
ncbi:hypothetical protein [Sphingomonas sp. Leaf23]|uniref:hypothetical protein n=1 Tax=Sphingomonas sp. Leaf23 TaxID=1735689 RepID=UPI000A51C828|nr:hypothetical protein [Sphingomonas sp. Leaf23]